MKVLKIIGMIIAGLIALFLIIAALLPSSYRVERSVEIDKPADVIYPQVAGLKNWENWDPWTKMEPDAPREYLGADMGAGAGWSWDGKKIGTGSLEIIKAEPNRSLRTHLKFTDPQPMESNGVWQFDEKNGSTRVTWAMQGTLGWPVERYFGLGMDAMLGPDFEKGLENLKKHVESLPDTARIEE